MRATEPFRKCQHGGWINLWPVEWCCAPSGSISPMYHKLIRYVQIGIRRCHRQKFRCSKIERFKNHVGFCGFGVLWIGNPKISLSKFVPIKWCWCLASSSTRWNRSAIIGNLTLWSLDCFSFKTENLLQDNDVYQGTSNEHQSKHPGSNHISPDLSLVSEIMVWWHVSR